MTGITGSTTALQVALVPNNSGVVWYCVLLESRPCGMSPVTSAKLLTCSQVVRLPRSAWANLGAEAAPSLVAC